MSRTNETEADRMEALYSPDWLTPSRCAELSGVGPDVIRAACDAGEITWSDKRAPGASRRHILIRREWWEEWEESRTHQADAA